MSDRTLGIVTILCLVLLGAWMIYDQTVHAPVRELTKQTDCHKWAKQMHQAVVNDPTLLQKKSAVTFVPETEDEAYQYCVLSYYYIVR